MLHAIFTVEAKYKKKEKATRENECLEVLTAACNLWLCWKARHDGVNDTRKTDNLWGLLRETSNQ